MGRKLACTALAVLLAATGVVALVPAPPHTALADRVLSVIWIGAMFAVFVGFFLWLGWSDDEL